MSTVQESSESCKKSKVKVKLPDRFQCIAWNNEDIEEGSEKYSWDTEEDDQTTSESSEEKKFGDMPKKDYIIRGYGRTLDGTSVSIKLTGYEPYFYIELPDNTHPQSMMRLKSQLVNVMQERFQEDLLSVKLVKAKKFYGFTNNRTFNFAAVFFRNEQAKKALERAFYKKQMIPLISRKCEYLSNKLFESNIPPLLRFFHRTEIKPCGWIDISKLQLVSKANKETTSQIELKGEWNDVKAIECDDIAPFVVAVMDIECFSSDADRMPIAKIPADKVIQIGTTYRKLGQKDCYRRSIITLNSCDELENTVVIPKMREKDVIIEWAKEIQREDPDIISGYNTFGFDYAYLYERAQGIHHVEHLFGRLGRKIGKITELEKKELKSSALGDNIMYLLARVYF